MLMAAQLNAAGDEHVPVVPAPGAARAQPRSADEGARRGDERGDEVLLSQGESEDAGARTVS